MKSVFPVWFSLLHLFVSAELQLRLNETLNLSRQNVSAFLRIELDLPEDSKCSGSRLDIQLSDGGVFRFDFDDTTTVRVVFEGNGNYTNPEKSFGVIVCDSSIVNGNLEVDCPKKSTPTREWTVEAMWKDSRQLGISVEVEDDHFRLTFGHRVLDWIPLRNDTQIVGIQLYIKRSCSKIRTRRSLTTRGAHIKNRDKLADLDNSKVAHYLRRKNGFVKNLPPKGGLEVVGDARIKLKKVLMDKIILYLMLGLLAVPLIAQLVLAFRALDLKKKYEKKKRQPITLTMTLGLLKKRATLVSKLLGARTLEIRERRQKTLEMQKNAEQKNDRKGSI